MLLKYCCLNQWQTNQMALTAMMEFQHHTLPCSFALIDTSFCMGLVFELLICSILHWLQFCILNYIYYFITPGKNNKLLLFVEKQNICWLVEIKNYNKLQYYYGTTMTILLILIFMFVYIFYSILPIKNSVTWMFCNLQKKKIVTGHLHWKAYFRDTIDVGEACVKSRRENVFHSYRSLSSVQPTSTRLYNSSLL